MKFPEKHYVGFNKNGDKKVLLGFLTPYGEDAASKKRISTVDAWRDSKIDTSIMANKPLIGFKLICSQRRYSSFGNGNVKWRIEDPRGFELEITSEILSDIISECTIEKGEIQEQMVWGREGSNNYLIPSSSTLYTDYISSVGKKKVYLSKNDIKVGDKILFENGREQIFVGFRYVFTEDREHLEEIPDLMSKKDGFTVDFSKENGKLSYIFASDITMNYFYYYTSKPKMVKVISSEKIDEDAIDKKIADGGVYGYKDCIFVSRSDIKQLSFKSSYDELNISEATDMIEKAISSSTKTMFHVEQSMLSGNVLDFYKKHQKNDILFKRKDCKKTYSVSGVALDTTSQDENEELCFDGVIKCSSLFSFLLSEVKDMKNKKQYFSRYGCGRWMISKSNREHFFDAKKEMSSHQEFMQYVTDIEKIRCYTLEVIDPLIKEPIVIYR